MTRVRRWAVAAVGVLVAAIPTTWGLREAEVLAHQTAEVAVPPDTASPKAVVRAFLDAVDAHDCAAAVALWTPETADEARSWCDDVATLTDVGLRLVTPEPLELAAGVDVSFDLRWRTFHEDASMPSGPVGWGFSLGRATLAGPWRIDGQGVG